MNQINPVFRIIILSSVYFGVYSLMTFLITTTEARAIKMLKAMKPKEKRSSYAKYIRLAGKCFSKYIILQPFYKQKLKRQLEKVGEKEKTPQEHIAEIWVTGSIWALLGVMFWISTYYMVSMGCFLVGLAATVNKAREIEHKISEINASIELELPQFIRSFGQALNSEQDIIKILEKYRQICGKAFRYDLDILITELKTGNYEEALYRFDQRLNIPVVTSLVAGLVGTSKGIDHKTFFYILERDIKLLANSNLQKMLDKRPQKIKLASVIVVISFITIFTYPLIINILDGLKIFK